MTIQLNVNKWILPGHSKDDDLDDFLIEQGKSSTERLLIQALFDFVWFCPSPSSNTERPTWGPWWCHGACKGSKIQLSDASKWCKDVQSRTWIPKTPGQVSVQHAYGII